MEKGLGCQGLNQMQVSQRAWVSVVPGITAQKASRGVSITRPPWQGWGRE